MTKRDEEGKSEMNVKNIKDEGRTRTTTTKKKKKRKRETERENETKVKELMGENEATEGTER